MRAVSDRFRALVPHPNRWETSVQWSNDGWRTVQDATFVDGSVTASSLSQIRWTADLTVAGPSLDLDGMNAFSTQFRVMHGLPGESLAMGVYKVTSAAWSSDSRDTIQVRGSSFEVYLIGARFLSARSFPRQSASRLAGSLIREVLPGASLSWEVDDDTLPGITEARDRWPLIDGDRDATSIARAAGARIYAGPAGNWIARPVPTLADDPVWEASEGDEGVLISHAEELTDEGVYNIVVVNGQSTDTDVAPFRPGIAQDVDRFSPTYVGKPVTAGGFGPRPRFYTSELIRSTAQAQKAANGMLAPYLGLRQKVSFSQVHDPTLEPGDVGIVNTANGPRRVLLDELTYSLLGEPLTAATRTTATTLVGNEYVPPDDAGDVG